MSLRYKGAVISATPPTTTGGNSGTAPGAWTLQQQLQAQGAGNWPNQPVYYIEDVFSTWLYTGNGSTQTITNGIDLSGQGGMTWIKQRSATRDNLLFDTTRGATQRLFSNLALAQSQDTQSLTAFNANGFSIGSDSGCNINGGTYASWTFREQPKFFDVVTYTGNSTNSRQITHSLQSAPGMIVVKNTTTGSTDWMVYHRSRTGGDRMLVLNSTAAEATYSNASINDATSTYFRVDGSLALNQSGNTYVAYLFAHNAGGFGTSNTDNVISCGSFTTDGSGNATVNLGYEPQWIMYKRSDGTSNWFVVDNMRGMTADGTDANLFPNLSAAESSGSSIIAPSATGFSGKGNLDASATYIYIAIRRGPMKTPTTGTSVLAMSSQANNTVYPYANVFNAGFPPDWAILKTRDDTLTWRARPRLTGNQYMAFPSTAAESTQVAELATISSQNELSVQSTTASAATNILYAMRRAPGFFDVVCYTGTGSVRTINHNLGVAPEMMIVKVRGANSGSWRVYHSALGPTKLATLNLTNAAATLSTIWNDTAPTASVFTVGTYGEVNLSGDTFVAYLFASCPGVSKVGSYTGTGATQTIDCGFSGGARWVLIKRTDSTSDWFVWDTTRGMVAGTDPSLSLNTTAVEVNANSAYTNTGGFQLLASPAADVNTNGGSYIYLAIA